MVKVKLGGLRVLEIGGYNVALKLLTPSKAVYSVEFEPNPRVLLHCKTHGISRFIQELWHVPTAFHFNNPPWRVQVERW